MSSKKRRVKASRDVVSSSSRIPKSRRSASRASWSGGARLDLRKLGRVGQVEDATHASSSQLVARDPDRDADEKRPPRGIVTKRPESLEKGEERLLDVVLGLPERPERPREEATDERRVAIEKQSGRLPVCIRAKSFEELRVIHLVGRRPVPARGRDDHRLCCHRDLHTSHSAPDLLPRSEIRSPTLPVSSGYRVRP